MSDKKNIDRLFQEKFKNFEVTPDDAVWKKIQAQKNKDRKRVILLPFWYRIAGVAALIAVILSVGSVLLTDTTKTDAIVVTEDQEKTDVVPKDNQKDKILKDQLVDTPRNQESDHSDGASKSSNTSNEAITNNSLQTNDKEDNSFDISTDRNSVSNKNVNNNTLLTQNTIGKKEIQEASIAEENTDVVISNNKKKDKILFDQLTNVTSTGITDSKNPDTAIIDKQETTDNIISGVHTTTRITENNTSTNKESEDIIEETSPYQQDPGKKQNDTKEAIAENAKDTGNVSEEEVSNQTTDQSQDDGKKSIFDAIKEKEEKETLVAETNKGKRWNISPNVAPVYYDSFGGSSIDPQFSDNNKQGEVNLSYGIQVAYAINKRLIVRSGVNKVDVGYNTEDVAFGISSVTRGDNSFTNVQSIIVSDYQGASTNFTPAPVDINDEILVKSQNPGLLNHSIGYIEVPLELKYSLTDSKIGIHMIGGVSTLFLEDEEVSIIAGSFKNQNVAREETVNDVSFSGNIGIGFDYKLSDQFQINMEPIFKYQFNGFKESAQDFRPYYFGVYTGISFKF
ncbi:hypothetical protein [Aquimarina rubra]|uniref:Outer membrane protein beta-barrel domain-containing protein n=1 Tax=Aquimarina rubra TaxID=1920033 RepID=A0ABW5LG18_9FLAO